MSNSVVITVSYGSVENKTYTRSTHLLTYSDVAAQLTEESSKLLADDIIETLKKSNMFGVYKEEFPNTVKS